MFGLDRTATRVVQIGAIVVVLLFALAIFTMINKPSARNEAKVAGSVGKQLDRVSAETPIIRDDQRKKEDEVENLPGADAPLPDGFAADLQRLRDGKRRDSRQPQG